MANPELTLRYARVEQSEKNADWTFLHINHCRELVKSGFIWEGDLICDGNYAYFLDGEVKKDTEFDISISALEIFNVLLHLYVCVCVWWRVEQSPHIMV